MKKLDISVFDKEVSCISIGRLDSEMIEFLISKNPGLNGRLSPDKEILFWKDRIKHTEMHRNDFSSDQFFETCLESIPEIIKNPDYISIHPKDSSISFIKDYSQHVAVAVRVSLEGKMSYRTMYPLMDAQLMNYIERGRAWSYPRNIDK